MKSKFTASDLEVRRKAMSARRVRRPVHRFHNNAYPWEIAPFMIAPVLPGETLTNIHLQARAVTDPVASKLVGWWQEMGFWYVRLSDLSSFSTMSAALLDPTTDMSSLAIASAQSFCYTPVGGIPYVYQSLVSIVNNYFRAPDETMNTALYSSAYPVAPLIVKDGWQSAVLSAEAADGDVDLDLNADSTITAAEAEDAIKAYEFLRQQYLVDMSYDDYLETYGVRSGSYRKEGKPELLRYIRDWQYPANTVDPNDGSVTSAVSWVLADRTTRRRFFPEPGFIVGLAISRPKVYFGNQTGALASFMNDAYTWFPAMLKNDERIGWRKFAASSNGPLAGNTAEYQIDIRDLLVYGDQFANRTLAASANKVALPNAALTNKRYPSLTDAQAMFAGASYYTRMDGVVQLDIRSHIRDVTMRT